METKPTVSDLLSKSEEEIVDFLGGMYEHSRWVAEGFYKEFIQGKNSTSISNVRELHDAMASVVSNASTEKKMELLCLHPDL